MSDPELQQKKERMAESSITESLLDEEQEMCVQRCGECDGELRIKAGADDEFGARMIKYCVDCGIQFCI